MSLKRLRITKKDFNEDLEWVFGLCPMSAIVNILQHLSRKVNISETASDSTSPQWF
jgi:hypothetical protein